MAEFNKWTAKEAAEAIPDQNAEWLKMNLAFADGDHWQSGRAWIGPMLADGSEGQQIMMGNVENTFVPQNAIGELVGRHVAGVIGENPQKSKELVRPLTFGANTEDDEPTTAEAELLAEAGALLSSWWNGRHGVLTRNGRVSRVSPQEVFQEATRTMLLTQRGPLRLIIPANLLSVDEDGRSRIDGTGQPLADVLTKIHIQHPRATQATVATDGGSMDQAGVYTYKKDEQVAAEICFVDEDGNTVIRLVQADVKEAVDYPLKLGGRLTMFEMERPLFIDETKRRLQRSLNLARTSESRNIVDGGFLERLYLNTQMPGEWSEDASEPGGMKFTPSKVNLGPNTANFMTGTPIWDEETGQIKGYATPQVVYRNPTPADVFVATAADIYTALLHEASQLHVLAQGGGSEISGEFIVQARADFETSLKQTKSALDAALTWCFDTVLTLAAAIAGDPTHFDALKISGSAIINSGPLSIGERQAIISAYEKGLLSKETAVRMLGAENVSAELERIEGEESARLNTLKLQAEILEILGRAAVALPAAVQTVQDGEISDATIRGDFVIGGDDE